MMAICKSGVGAPSEQQVKKQAPGTQEDKEGSTFWLVYFERILGVHFVQLLLSESSIQPAGHATQSSTDVPDSEGGSVPPGHS